MQHRPFFVGADVAVLIVFLCFLFLVLQGNASCEIENCGGVVKLKPLPGCPCLLNDREVTEPCRLAQGQFSSEALSFSLRGF